MENLESLWRKGYFPETKKLVRATAERVRQEAGNRAFKRAPAYWARQALSDQPGGGGGFGIREIEGGSRVYYRNRGAYNYFSIIQRGRGRYDMKKALLSSPRARNGKQGPYIVVPLPAGGRSASRILKKKETRIDAGSQPRNRYRQVGKGDGSGSNTVGFRQDIKGGGSQTSRVTWVAVSGRSSGWIYPAIRANPVERILQRESDQFMQSDGAKRTIKKDVEAFLQKTL